MVLPQSIRRPVVAVLAASLVLSAIPAAVAAHLGESSHVHVPGNSSTLSSAVWCVSFTQDPGAWRPESATSIDASQLDGVRIVFEDCDEILDGYYAIESYSDGATRTTVGDPVIRSSDSTTQSEPSATQGGESAKPQAITVKAWTKHQKQWLQKGDKLSARLPKANTEQQARRGLGSIQKHILAEMKWLKKNRSRFEPESCLAEDMARWKKRVQQAQKSLNKAITALNRGNLAAASSNARQFGRAWTKVEQIYRVGVCDF